MFRRVARSIFLLKAIESRDCVCPPTSSGNPAQRTPSNAQLAQRRQIPRPACSGGRKSRNPYLLFLRRYRSTHCELRSQVDVVRQGAQVWRTMSEREKKRFERVALTVPALHRKRRDFGTIRSNRGVANGSRGKRTASGRRRR